MFKATTHKYHIRSIKRMNWAARQLRYRSTSAERVLWNRLRQKQLLGFKFRRQHALYRYIVDFLCDELKLIIEVDGGVHDHHIEHDQYRDEFLQQLGYRVIHFTNEEVLYNTEVVIKKITPLLKGGGCHEP